MNARLVVATNSGGLDDQVSSVFGRSPTFTKVELLDSAVADATVIPNPHKDAPSGAGIQAAQLVASNAPCAVLAGSFGPKVAGVLSQAGIQMLPVSGMTVAQAIDQFLANRLSPSTGSAAAPRGGLGRGGGAGPGRVQGMSGRPRGAARMPQAPAQPEDPRVLRQRAEQLARELEDVKQRLVQLEGGG